MTVDKSLPTATSSRSLSGSAWFAKAAIALCVVLLLIAAIPRYLQGRPPIDSIPDAPIASLQTLRDQGLTLDNWTSVDLQNIQLGPNRWVMQTLSWDSPEPPDGQTDRATLLMSPQRVQDGTSAQPQMEWIDIRGLGRAQGQRWSEDQHQQLQFTISPEPGTSTEVQARYFRGRTERRSFAIAQWYAWENGGHPSLVRWFWRDRLARLHNRRLPWVAVSVIVPIEHLSQVDDVRPFLKSFAQQVHTALLEQGFASTSTPD